MLECCGPADVLTMSVPLRGMIREDEMCEVMIYVTKVLWDVRQLPMPPEGQQDHPVHPEFQELPTPPAVHVKKWHSKKRRF